MYIACMKIERSNLKFIFFHFFLLSFMLVFVAHSSFSFPISSCLHSVMGNNEFSLNCLLYFPMLFTIFPLYFSLFLYLFELCWQVEKEITGIFLRKENIHINSSKISTKQFWLLFCNNYFFYYATLACLEWIKEHY